MGFASAPLPPSALYQGCPSLVFLGARGREAHHPGELHMCGVFWIWIASAGVLIQEAPDDQVPNVNAAFLVDWYAANTAWQLRLVMWCQFILTKLISKETITSMLSLSWDFGSGVLTVTGFSKDLVSARDPSWPYGPSNKDSNGW